MVFLKLENIDFKYTDPILLHVLILQYNQNAMMDVLTENAIRRHPGLAMVYHRALSNNQKVLVLIIKKQYILFQEHEMQLVNANILQHKKTALWLQRAAQTADGLIWDVILMMRSALFQITSSLNLI